MSILDGIQAAVFDLDGVLLDTEPLYTQATQTIVAEYGHRYEWSLKSRMMGMAAVESATVLVNALKLPISVDEYLARKDPLLESLFPSAEPMPGAPRTVQALKQRGLRLAIATSSKRRFFEIKSAAHDWFRDFDAIICGDDPEVGHPKPAPDIFLTAARRLGVRPETCLAFEDSAAGVRSAIAANMRVIALPDPRADMTQYAGVHRIITSHEELVF